MLLGEMSEFKETIAMSLTLREEIENIITDKVEATVETEDCRESVIENIIEILETATFQLKDSVISLKDKLSIAQSIWEAIYPVLQDENVYTINNEREAAISVLGKVEDFVNDNYLPYRNLI